MATSEAGMIRADLRLPDVPGLDDAGLAHWFPGFDGQWTEQTKTLLRAHGATGLDLNANWAGVPADWHCTCCRRPKPMIVRKARNGVLLAHLDLHHDHLRDHLQSLVGAWVGVSRVEGAGAGSAHAGEHMRALVVRFRDTLVCDACNAADGTAKRLLGSEIHPAFSFSPAEIGRFIRPRSNALHEVDVEAACRTWSEVRHGFEDRLAFAALLVERLASGSFAQERGPDAVMAFAVPADERMIDRWVRDDPDLHAMRTWQLGIEARLRAVSVRRDAVGNSGRARKPVAGRRPTAADIAAFERQAGKGWQRTPPDWACPCCGRGKPAILRISGGGKWFAELRTHSHLELETDPQSREFRHALYGHGGAGLVVALRRQVYVCSDCGDVSSRLQSARPVVDRRPTLTLEDMRECLGEVRDNEKPEIDVAKAEACDRANLALAVAEAEFVRHRSLAIDLWVLRLKFGRHPDIAAALTGRARSEGLDVEAIPAAMRWLLRQGEALHAAHVQEIEQGRPAG
ncbi:hypothetical protein M6G65_17220 [Methylobacterium tardum]|uniref:hypothetical protein n=1 Tax=Methylobacterium tardum TaxID=374432 RepID=UPI002020815A|nr:hypothetical protein [Methylobacterium tardum]URD34376.1 hypothetical protein M6G65_17220 [Methylobacterium tardum]